MGNAKTGDTVKIRFTGKLDDGTVFGSTAGAEPVEFELGAGRVIPGVEQAVKGMSEGESKTVKVGPEQAYGEHRAELVKDVSRDRFPKESEPKVGQTIEIPQQNGQRTAVRVVEISESSITLDANHPLAGKDLTFELELVGISSKGE